MGLFIWTSNHKLVWISILRVKRHGVFSTMVMAVDDCEESCLTKLERVGDFHVEQAEEGILVGVVLLDAPNHGKIILELHDLTDVGAFAHFLVGGDGHGSELPLDGRATKPRKCLCIRMMSIIARNYEKKTKKHTILM
jgi:hypothetical protein